MEREFCKFRGVWNTFVDWVDADSSELNQRLNYHREQHNETQGWCCTAEELAGRHEQWIEILEDLTNKVVYIESLEMGLSSLVARVETMEGSLC